MLSMPMLGHVSEEIIYVQSEIGLGVARISIFF